MGNYEAGTLLTCEHGDCPCRIRVEVECHCDDAGQAYRCTCGEEMVPTEEPSSEDAVTESA